MSIRESHYYELINQCREYGYSEDTIHNINSCLRKLIKIAYQNRYIKENPLDYWDTPRINPGAKREIITTEEFRLMDQCMADSSFVRCGADSYLLYRFMLNILFLQNLYSTRFNTGFFIATLQAISSYKKEPAGF